MLEDLPELLRGQRGSASHRQSRLYPPFVAAMRPFRLSLPAHRVSHGKGDRHRPACVLRRKPGGKVAEGALRLAERNRDVYTDRPNHLYRDPPSNCFMGDSVVHARDHDHGVTLNENCDSGSSRSGYVPHSFLATALAVNLVAATLPLAAQTTQAGKMPVLVELFPWR